MIFSLYIQSAPGSATALSAFRFAEALLVQEHHLYRVFFHGDGVYHGSRLACIPRGEFDLAENWRKLQSTWQFDLLVCIAAATKRGILDHREAERYEKQTTSLYPEFQLSGLGQWVDAVTHSDRVITFGGGQQK